MDGSNKYYAVRLSWSIFHLILIEDTRRDSIVLIELGA
jgi:hypothetical protein